MVQTRTERVSKLDEVKILRDYSIPSDHVIKHKRPDLTVLEKEK